MEMFYLVIRLAYGVAVIPEKYTYEECQKAIRVSRGDSQCIPAPKAQPINTEPLLPKFPSGCVVIEHNKMLCSQ